MNLTIEQRLDREIGSTAVAGYQFAESHSDSPVWTWKTDFSALAVGWDRDKRQRFEIGVLTFLENRGEEI